MRCQAKLRAAPPVFQVLDPEAALPFEIDNGLTPGADLILPGIDDQLVIPPQPHTVVGAQDKALVARAESDLAAPSRGKVIAGKVRGWCPIVPVKTSRLVASYQRRRAL